ncbi:LysM peptidoglycan-binding domain-containing protein, partial [Vibrio brasiliensis]
MTTYTIQPGDTLLQIAIDQGVEYVDLLTLNPQCQTDPNYIRAGDTLTLPKEVIIEVPEPDYSPEPPSTALEPKCTGEI